MKISLLILFICNCTHLFAQDAAYKDATKEVCKCLQEKLDSKDTTINWITETDKCIGKSLYGNLRSITKAKKLRTTDASTMKGLRQELDKYASTHCDAYQWAMDLAAFAKSKKEWQTEAVAHPDTLPVNTTPPPIQSIGIDTIALPKD